MTGTAKTSPLEPNEEMMLEYLELMFGGDRCGELHDCWIELGYTDSGGNLNKAAHFGTHELEKMAEHGARLNRIDGTNIFVSLALRKKDIRLNYRTGKEAVAGVVSLWSDLDTKGAAEAMKERARFCLPNLVVVTGRTPHLRAQGFWRLEEPMTDIAEIEAALGSIQQALGGDRAVVDASRVMRMPGSIAYAHKPGRIPEMTDLKATFPDPKDDGKLKPRPLYPAGQVARAFKPISAGGQAPEPEQAQGPAGAAGSGPSNDDPHAKNPFTGRFDGEALLRSIRPGNWYVPMRDFVAHMVGLGRADYEIRRMTKEYDEPGHQGITVQDIIDRTRVKYNRPNPDHSAEFDFSQEPAALSFMSASNIVIEDLECRPWLFGGWLMKGIVSMLVGPGGAGKSMVSIHAALAYAAGREWAGQKPFEEGGAWIWNNEDDLIELQRRVGGTAKHMGIDLKALGGRLLLGSGVKNKHNMDAKRLVLARLDERGEVVATPDVPKVIKIIKENGIKVFAVDPMVSIHFVNENDNGAMAKVMDILLTIAAEGDCAVVVVHHTAKPGQNVQQAGNQYISRGATSVPGASRLLLTVTQMTEDDAKHMMGEEYDERMRKHCIRIDTGKANMLEPGDDTVFLEKVSISLGNGPGKRLEDGSDKIGGLKVADFSAAQHEAKMKEQDRTDRMLAMVAEIMRGIPAGDEMKLKELVTLILKQTIEFGKERWLRDSLDAAIPMASAGGVRIGEHLYYRRQDGPMQTSTIYVCKREVP